MSDIESTSDLEIPYGNSNKSQNQTQKDQVADLFDSDSDSDKVDSKNNTQNTNLQTKNQSSEVVNNLFDDSDSGSLPNMHNYINNNVLTKSNSDYDSDDDVDRPPQQFIISDCAKPDNINVDMMTLGNIFGIMPTPFDPATYSYKDEKEELQKINRLSRENCILRWRWKRDENGEIVNDESGQPIRETNAHVVEWEDGSKHLYIGQNIINLKTVDDSFNSQCLLVAQKAEQVSIRGKFESWYESQGIISNKVLTHIIKAPSKDQYLKEHTQSKSDVIIMPDYIVTQEAKKIPKKRRATRGTELSSDFLEKNIIEEEDDSSENDIGKIKERSKKGTLKPSKRRSHSDSEDDFIDNSYYSDDDDNDKEKAPKRKRMNKAKNSSESEEEYDFEKNDN